MKLKDFADVAIYNYYWVLNEEAMCVSVLLD